VQITGNTAVLPLFDLVQMLSVNEATGMLKVENQSERGYLYLQQGKVINALDGSHKDGEDAAKRVFALRDARFSFSPELPSVAERIQCSTQSLMMEVARRLDEEGIGVDGGASPTDRVREVQQATEALHQIFRELDADSRILSLRANLGVTITDLLAPLRASAGAVLHVREGALPETRDGARMTAVGATPLDGRGYQEVRDLLLRGAAALGPVGSEVDAYSLSVGSNERYRVERTRWTGGEMITVRFAPDEEELRASLPWPAAALDELLAAPGAIVLVTAREYPDVSRAFASACAHLLYADTGPNVAFARRWTPSARRAGTILLSTLVQQDVAEGLRLIDRFAPALVAVEDADCRTALGAAQCALKAGSRALIGACAPSPAQVLERLLDGLPAPERDSWLTLLRGLRAVLTTEGAVLPVDGSARTALLAGDTGPLMAALVHGAG
jgi:hypothetical protein